ncbi:MAG: isoprenylcysteine carboxylmethyltransferase family protein [Planctomycetota bacterium]
MPASKRPTIRRIFVYACIVAVLVLARPVVWLYPVGAFLVVVGEVLRIWACGHLRKNKDVIMSGPYAHVKNPLYLGTFLIMVGFSLCASNPNDTSRYVLFVGLPFFLAVFFVYYLPYKVRVEGDRLRRRFGDRWEEYDRNVPAFIPRLTAYQADPAPFSATLVAENSEVPTALWVLAGLAVVFLKFFLGFP